MKELINNYIHLKVDRHARLIYLNETFIFQSVILSALCHVKFSEQCNESTLKLVVRKVKLMVARNWKLNEMYFLFTKLQYRPPLIIVFVTLI